MSLIRLYGLVAAGILGLAMHSLIASRHLLSKLIGANVLGSGVFLLFVALATRGAQLDPVPVAMVLTGIVVAVAVTGLAVALIRRVHTDTGRAVLPEDEPDEPGGEAP